MSSDVSSMFYILSPSSSSFSQHSFGESFCCCSFNSTSGETRCFLLTVVLAFWGKWVICVAAPAFFEDVALPSSAAVAVFIFGDPIHSYRLVICRPKALRQNLMLLLPILMWWFIIFHLENFKGSFWKKKNPFKGYLPKYVLLHSSISNNIWIRKDHMYEKWDHKTSLLLFWWSW